MRISSACLPNRAGQVYSVEKLAQALNLSISRAQATLAELCQRPALLHLHGPNWIGKTSLAHHLALEWCRVSGVVYRVCPDLMTDLRASIGFGGNPSQTLREMRVDPRALIFDEVGEGRSTDFTLSLYEGVIGRRLEAGLATVLITNLSGRGELRAAVGDRCFSRLGNAQIVEMG